MHARAGCGLQYKMDYTKIKETNITLFRCISERNKVGNTLLYEATVLKYNPCFVSFRFRTENVYCKNGVCVHVTSSNSQIQNEEVINKGFNLIRHKRYQIYSCLQLSSPIASSVWKPAHFEFRSYGGAWHNPTIAFCWKIYTYLEIFSHFRSLSIRKSAFVNFFLFGLDNQWTE